MRSTAASFIDLDATRVVAQQVILQVILQFIFEVRRGR